MLRRVSGRGLVGRIAGAALLALLTSAMVVGAALADGVRVGSEAEVAPEEGTTPRAGPAPAGKVVGAIKKGNCFSVVGGPEKGADGPWYKVDYDGALGWVFGTFLSRARPRQAPP